jgi:hypothetical protein
MPYRFEPGRIYRMPTHFGAAPGPRQIPAEANADPARSPRKILVSASFLTEGQRSNVTFQNDLRLLANQW